MEEENKITLEEAFFKSKSELEQKIVTQLKEFAGTFATSVVFKGCVDVQPISPIPGSLLKPEFPMLRWKLK